MNFSHNVLKIESLSTIPETGREVMKIKGEMKVSIEFRCSVNGNHFRTMIITSESQGYSHKEAIKNAIQNFIDGKTYIDNKYYQRDIQSIACNKIHHIDIQVQEPFKSLFEGLFTTESWTIPMQELSNR